MKSSIKKAVFPVGGMGVRFLPATKASPKEMMPIVDKPLIQYAVEEAIASGITEIIFITSSTKRSIEDHFDINYELEDKLRRQGKQQLLEIIQNIIPKGISYVYIRQSPALGLGQAVLCAKKVVGNEPFAVILADDLITGSKVPCLQQMIHQFENVQASVIAVQKVAPEESEKYGIVGFDNKSDVNDIEKINQIVEKPKSSQAPSSFGVVGRYVLTPEIFSFIEKVQPDHNNEIQLTDAISLLLQKESVYAYQFKGERFDCGSKLGYLQAIIAFGLQHKEIGMEFKEFLNTL